jgi:hypothetical protein
MPRETPEREERAERPAPKAASVDPSATYFAGPAGTKPTKMTVAQLQELVDAGSAAGVKVHKDGQWVKLLDSGLVELPPPSVDEAPPEVPEDDAPPEVPDDDAPPSVPEDDAPPAEIRSDGEITKDEMRKRIFPDAAQYEAMDDATKAKAEKLIERAYIATDRGRKRELPPELIDEMLEIVG